MKKQDKDKRGWWSSLGMPPDPLGGRKDLGDMGTAFGLDASLTPTLPMPLDFEHSNIEPPPGERR